MRDVSRKRRQRCHHINRLVDISLYPARLILPMSVTQAHLILLISVYVSILTSIAGGIRQHSFRIAEGMPAMPFRDAHYKKLGGQSNAELMMNQMDMAVNSEELRYNFDIMRFSTVLRNWSKIKPFADRLSGSDKAGMNLR